MSSFPNLVVDLRDPQAAVITIHELTWPTLPFCTLKFRRGFIRRTMFREGQHFMGFTIGCPRCGARQTALHTAHKFAEGPWVETFFEAPEDEGPSGLVRHPSLLTSETPVTCYSCRRSYRIKNGKLLTADA